MPAPRIIGVGPNLFTNKKSKIWICGEGLAEGDIVKVVSAGYEWEGEVKKVDAGAGKQRAQIDLKIPRKKKTDEEVDEDFAEITVTVTNGNGEESEPAEDGTVIDGPEGP
jgi:hypothetical protein